MAGVVGATAAEVVGDRQVGPVRAALGQNPFLKFEQQVGVALGVGVGVRLPPRLARLLGVPDSQVEAVSFGKEKPAAQGSDEASLAKNRRVEVKYR